MKNQLQLMYETALLKQREQKDEVTVVASEEECERILACISSSTTSLLIDTMKSSNKDILCEDMADLMFQVFRLMAYKNITMEDIHNCIDD